MDQFPFFYNADFDDETNKKVNMEIIKYAGMYVLKMLDMPPDQGGHVFEVPLSGPDERIEPVLDDLMFHSLVTIDEQNFRYALTDEGTEYIGKLLDEIEGYIAKYQEFEPTTKVNLMKRDRVNPLRARFLWGLYDGEFDDFKQWQENWNIDPAEQTEDWQDVVVMKEFYDMLFDDINNMAQLDDAALDQVLQEAQADREKEKAIEKANAPQVQINKVEGSNGNGRNHRDDRDDDYYYHDPYYHNPVHDPLFWYIVF